MGTISDYHTPKSHPENPRRTQDTHPCLQVEKEETNFPTWYLSFLFNGFLDRWYLQYLNSAGMNLNGVRIKLREKENQLSSRYDRGPLNSVIILRKRHNISERYLFGTRKHLKLKMGGRKGGGVRLGGVRFFWWAEPFQNARLIKKNRRAHNPLFWRKSHP